MMLNEDYKGRLERMTQELNDKLKFIDKKEVEYGKAKERLAELEREVFKQKEQNRLLKLESEEKDLTIDSYKYGEKNKIASIELQVTKLKDQNARD